LRAFNAQDVEAAAAMYHPEASIVQIDDVHGGTSIARGADAIRKTMAAYIGLKPHMDVVTHHTTVAGDFAMTRSQTPSRRPSARSAACPTATSRGTSSRSRARRPRRPGGAASPGPSRP
jgi:hypothetical protein